MSERSETTANTILNVGGLRKTCGGVAGIKNIASELALAGAILTVKAVDYASH